MAPMSSINQLVSIDLDSSKHHHHGVTMEKLLGIFFIVGLASLPQGYASQSYGFISYNYPKHSIGVFDTYSAEAYITIGDPEPFHIRAGLGSCPSGHECVSFESKVRPNYFLRHSGYKLWLHVRSNTQLYKNDATFIRHRSKFIAGYNAYESANYRNFFIRHSGYRLYIHNSGSNPSYLYKMDSSFLETRLGQVTSLQSLNYPAHNIGLKTTNNRPELYITRGRAATFRIITPGLTGVPGTVSFLSINFIGTFARHAGYVMWLDPAINQPLYRNDATFKQRNNQFFKGYVTFESVNYPKHFIRHQNARVKISKNDNSPLFKKDASFKVNAVANC